ncbi:MAG: hypothetical protein HFE90_00310 [Firmicutes bacterium]|nr:hypothetical protein [Bacillota bacterium]
MRGLTNSRSGGDSNLNLLDNWDFTNPVNQRGKSTYADEGYTIDRWRKIGGMVSINSDRLNLSGAHSSTSYIVDIRQLLDSDTISAIAGKTVTLSVDCAVNSISGEFYISLANDTKKEYPAPIFTSGFSRKIISHTQNIPSNWGAADSVRFTIGTNGTKVNADIYSAKLELGEVSTLKNDVLGVNYTKELLKSQRYYYDSRTENDMPDGRIRMKVLNESDVCVAGNAFFPVPMRSKPAITIYSEQGNAGNLNNGFSGEELKSLGAYAYFYGRDCFSQVNLNKPLSQVTTVKEVCFHYTASADL